MKAWVGRHPVAAFYLVAYAFSWGIAVPLALQAHGIFVSGWPWSFHYLTAFGPAVSALVISRLLGGRASGNRARECASAIGRPSPSGIRWLIVGFASPLVLFAAAQLTAQVTGNPAPSWIDLGRVNFLPPLGLTAWLLWLFTSGFGEELGWRGFALPRLQLTHSALTSSLLIGTAWAGWHVPAFFYVPSYVAIGPQFVPGFFLGVLSGSIVLTWLYNRSGGNVPAVILCHASFNFVTASPNAGGLVAAIISTVVMVWAVVLVLRYDHATLTKPTPSVHASVDERVRALPGDELISSPIASLTHAITIRCSRQDVWPWIAQMGAGRAGWYSYDFIDNGRHSSASRVIPELQDVTVGSIFPARPGATDAFLVIRYERERSLVLGWWRPDGRRLQITWTFVLDELEPECTRLVVRARGGDSYHLFGLPQWLLKALVPAAHFVMQRKQLLGIAHRAEERRAPMAA